MKKILFILLILNTTVAGLFAQQGKDGAANITATATVNIYTPLTANAPIGTTTISVASVTGFSVGDLIYIIQMQGANVKANIYEYGNPNNALPNDTSFGKITAYNGSGNNEFAEITAISSVANTITLDCGLKDSFGVFGRTQVIRVPRYTSLTISGAGQITCPAWNSSIGGVVAVEVQGNTTINGTTAVNVSAKGFRGGSVLNASGNSATNTGSNYGTPSANNGGHKGESIAGDTSIYKLVNYQPFTNISFSPLTLCKGNVANGGGGGDANNCGGGGGSNGGIIANWNGMGNADNSTANNISAWTQESTTPVNGSFRPTTSSGGGRGGYAFSGNNADPTTNGPNNNGVWAGDSRHNDGGWGGVPLDYTTGKLFLGGGGGAGDSNDKNGTSGGNGGGLFYLLSYGTVTGTGQIAANGATALNTNTNTGAGLVGDDGAGGGGGGGTVILNSTGNISLTNTLAISAQGGNGGSYQYHGITTTQNFGPGGGGGGGYVSTTNAVTGTNINGGVNGIVVNGGGNNTKISTKFPPNGATAGGAGSTNIPSSAPFYLTATNYTICASSAVSLSVTVNGTAPTGLSIMWYTAATGGTSVYSGNPYNITAPSTAGTYTYYAGTCPGTYRIPVVVSVTSASGPTVSISATSTTVCSGTPVVLTASGATSYTWGANAGSAMTNTVSVSPTGNTTYTVTGATTGGCAGTATASINITVNSSPTITITPSSYTLCLGSTATLTASSSVSTYTWSANAGSATTNTVAVTPTTTATTTYTVTGGSGTCISTQTVPINVIAVPSVSVSPTSAYICNGTSTILTASGATSYSWSTGAGINTVSVSPTSNTTYTVTGSNGGCSATKTVLVKVDGGPTATSSSSVDAACGQANGSYVLNSVIGGIPTYSINFNGAGFVSVTAFSYTVNNLAQNNYPIIIKDSLGCTYTTSVTINNAGGVTSATYSVTPDTCSKHVGTITNITPVGGTPSYSFAINGGTYQTTATFTALAAATYTLDIKDNNGCVFSEPVTITQTGSIATPTITASPGTTFCQGDSATLTSSATYYNTWSTGATADTTQKLIVKNAGNYFVTVSKNGCSASSNTITIVVNTLPVTQVTSVTNICQNQLPHVVPISGPTNATLTVSNSSGQLLSIPFTPSVTGVFFIKDSLNGCKTVTSVTVNVNPSPTAPPSVTTPVQYCLGQSASALTATATPSTATLNWSDANHNPISTPPNPTPATNILGITTYYVYQSIGNCSSLPDSVKVMIVANPNPNFTTVPSTSISVGQSISFVPAQTTTVNAYSWNFEDPAAASAGSTQQSPMYTYSGAGTYCPRLTVTNTTTGCVESTTICLDVLTGISMVIPNVFSPNGDGINDVFSIKATGFTSLNCDIFDRWGLKLYSFTGENGYWDGSEKTGKAVDGTYFYVIQTTDIKGEDHKYNGFIQLIK